MISFRDLSFDTGLFMASLERPLSNPMHIQGLGYLESYHQVLCNNAKPNLELA